MSHGEDAREASVYQDGEITDKVDIFDSHQRVWRSHLVIIMPPACYDAAIKTECISNLPPICGTETCDSGPWVLNHRSSTWLRRHRRPRMLYNNPILRLCWHSHVCCHQWDNSRYPYIIPQVVRNACRRRKACGSQTLDYT